MRDGDSQRIRRVGSCKYPPSSNGDIIIVVVYYNFGFLVVGFATALGYSIKTTEKFGIELNIS